MAFTVTAPTLRTRSSTSRGPRSLANCSQTATASELAGQRVADDRLGEAGALDQRVEVDSGLDAELLAQEDQLLAAHVAGGTDVTGERAPTEAGAGRIEAGDAETQRGVGVGHAEAPGVVEVQAEGQVRPAVTHRSEHPCDGRRPGEADGVGEEHGVQLDVELLGEGEDLGDSGTDVGDRDVSLIVAPEGG